MDLHVARQRPRVGQILEADVALRRLDGALRTLVLFDLVLLGEGAHAQTAQVQLMGTHVLVDVGHGRVFLVAHFALVDFALFRWRSSG